MRQSHFVFSLSPDGISFPHRDEEYDVSSPAPDPTLSRSDSQSLAGTKSFPSPFPETSSVAGEKREGGILESQGKQQDSLNNLPRQETTKGGPHHGQGEREE